MSPRRRTVLKAGLIGVPAVAVAGAGGLTWVYADTDVNTVGRVDFTNRLAIPPLAQARRDGQGRLVFELRAAPGRHRFRPGAATDTWGINGDYLGPTLRAGRGDTVVVKVRNDLDEATSLHWHGMHLPAAMDGGPHQPIAPGGTWSPAWTVDQPAATLWYHPHPHPRTARHAYRGLAGLFLVDGGETGLPKDYGVDDVPVIVQDKRFDGDNQLDESEPLFGAAGQLGDTICVNGTVGAYHDVATERVRLRLLNASNSRGYRFGLSDDRPFALVATDGGLLAAPHETNRVQLTPGERVEIVVTVRPGERVVLRGYPPELGMNFWNRRFNGGDDAFDVLQLRAADRLAASPPLPQRLAEPPGIDTATVAASRRFQLSGIEINGRRMDMRRIDEVITRGTTEIWEIIAIDEAPHNFHVHGVSFQVLSIGGQAPGPELAGWKDTVHTPPGVPVRIALRFNDFTDRDTPYMFHCHLLKHEDQGLMGQFVVVEPGDSAGLPAAHDGHGGG